VAEHPGEGGVGVDQDAIESDRQRGCGQSVQQDQRGQRVQVSGRGARRGSAASVGAALLHVHDLVGAVAVGFGVVQRGGAPGVWSVRCSAKSGEVVMMPPACRRSPCMSGTERVPLEFCGARTAELIPDQLIFPAVEWEAVEAGVAERPLCGWHTGLPGVGS
jgi:hypothetical protein